MELAPVFMFVVLLGFLFLGIPITFSLGMTSIIFAVMLWGLPGISLLISSAWGMMNNFTLLAIPLFIFMAILLEKTDVITDLYDSIYKWSGGLKGGLAIATILVGIVIGAVSGVVAAGVIGLGVIALPQMEKYKYDKHISLGAIAAGGTLGQVIPPSLNMVVYGAVAGVSVGRMFAGGVGIGLLLATGYIGYILVRSYMDKDLCPALPKDERASFKEKILSLKSVIAPLLLIVAVLGSILSGAATPTEGASVGCAGAFLYGLLTKRLSFDTIKEVSNQTFKISGMVTWIIFSAGAFGSVFTGTGGNLIIQKLAAMIPGGGWGIVIFASILVVILGMFLETIAIIMLIGPIISPIIVSYGFDPLWWGLLFMTLLQIGYISPPFGLSLFYLKGVTPPDVSISDLYRSSIPFIVIQVVAVILIMIYPKIVLWLPRLLFN